jgi:hypothetical protein
VDVVGGFFDEGVGYDGDHGGEDGFLGGEGVSVCEWL